MNDLSPPRLHWYLRRNAAGEVVIFWRRFGLVVAGTTAGALIGVGIARFFSPRPIQVARIVIPAVFVFIPQFLVLHVVKRRAEGRSIWQFSLWSLLAAMTVICVLLTMTVLDRRADLERFAAREALEKKLNASIAGSGGIGVGQQTSIVISLPTFGDQELKAILELHKQHARADSAIHFVALTGTAVTDAGVKLLQDVPTLEYCFLTQTQITDASIDVLEKLPNLKLLQVQSTKVTPERLRQLSIDRPELNIEPKSYQQLKNGPRSDP